MSSPLAGDRPTHPEPSRDRSGFLALLACFLLSGALGLLYETAWSTQLATVFGTSEMAVSAVLAAYLGGLAAGAAAIVRLGWRIRRPILAYGVLELLVGAAALGVGPALGLARRLQALLLGVADLDHLPPAGVSALFYVVVAGAVLVLPAAMMGATLPLLADHSVRRDAELGRRIGWLYAANTLGAAAGALGGAFLLLPRLGLASTVRLAAAGNGVVFLVALLLDRRLGGATADRPRRRRQPLTGARWALAIALLSGAVALALEVLWTRLLGQLLGGTVYGFGAMLGAFLVGLSIGAPIAGIWARTAEGAVRALIVAQGMVAVTTLAAFRLADLLPGLTGRGSFTLLAVACGALLLPTAVGLGMTFPCAVRLAAGTVDETRRAAAAVFSWNTIGAVSGALLAGHLLLPALGFAGTVRAAALVSLGLAAAVAILARPRRRVVVALALAATAAAAIIPLAPPWSILTHGALGGFGKTAERVVFSQVGRHATVLLSDTGAGSWRLTTDGLPESSIPRAGSPPPTGVVSWLSMLPQAARPELRSMLIIGLGAGLTVLAAPPTATAVHVVELEPAVVAANRFAAEWRGDDPLREPRVHLHVQDARGALSLVAQRFDAIVSQPSHPWTAGASHLFSRDFFQLVRQRLTDDGVFVQWMALPFADRSLLRSLLTSLLDVFDDVEVYAPSGGGGLLFLASPRPLAVERNAPRALEVAADAWRRQGVWGLDDLLASRILDGSEVRRFADDAPAVTDDRNLFRYRGAALLWQRGGQPDAEEIPRELSPKVPLGLVVRRLTEAGSTARARQLSGRLPPAERLAADGLIELRLGNRDAAERQLWRSVELEPASRAADWGLYQLYEDQLAIGEGPRGLARRLQGDPIAATVLVARRHLATGEGAELQGMTHELAAVPVDHPFFPAALELRAEAQLVAGGAAASAAALELADQVIGFGPTPSRRLLRARAGIAAGQPQVAVASLLPLLRGPASEELKGRARQIAESIAEQAARRELLGEGPGRVHPGQ